MRKYRSEAQIGISAQKEQTAPIWLSSNERRSSQANSNSAQAKKETESQSKSSLSRRSGQPNEDNPSNTYELLSKQSSSSSTQMTQQVESAKGSTRPHPYRDNNTSKVQIATGSSQLKPNALVQVGVSSTTSSSGQRIRFDSDSTSNQSQEQQAKQHPLRQSQIQETSDAIKQAVNKVNLITGVDSKITSERRQTEVMKPAGNIEESLDNLELFKATNLGRLLQNMDQKPTAETQQQQKPKQRSQWGMSPSHLRGQESASKHKGAHVLVKNPFPDKQLITAKSSSSIAGGQSVQKKTMNFEDDNDEVDDIIDQFLSVGVPSAKKKVATSKIQSDVSSASTPYSNDYVAGGQSALAKKPPQPRPAQVPETYEDKIKSFTQDFILPNLPMGSKLYFNILSTWGDVNYVGLTGIEIFDIEGKPIKVEDSQISACPPDINILPGYGGDPRTIDKLVDGNYFTNDDMHVWLTPFTSGEDHTITIDLPYRFQISMIRIWNYNKSRIHSYRGARLITCELDNKMIFRGEIQKAPGNLNDPENCCEIILFTDSEAIMEKIDKNDWINEKIVQSSLEDTQRIMQDVKAPFLEERPMTATKKFGTSELEEIQRHLRQQKPTSLFDQRPQTSAIIQMSEDLNVDRYRAASVVIPAPLSGKTQQQSEVSAKQKVGLKGRILELNIVETWGDLFYVGLTGIEVCDLEGKIIPINIANVTAEPRDMNSIAGHGSDYRTLDKLFDKVNNTTDDHHMWLIPFNKGEKHTITIDLGKVCSIGTIRFYNYNKSEEDTLRGAKQVVMWLDKKYVTPRKGVTLRKAPGFVHPLLNMGQDLQLPHKQGWTTDQIVPLQKPQGPLYLFQEYELMPLPMGFMFKINLYSTHGDFYYIGLNGIELYDQNGYLIRCNSIISQPQGVHTLPGMQSDIRVVTNLINGKNQTYDEQHMWLAPFKNTRSYSAVTNSSKQQQVAESADYRIPNFVCLVFDEPRAVSAIRLWNYSKTPSRGVNEFEILVDDKQIYRGFAKQAPEKSPQMGQGAVDFSTVVLFTSEDKIVEKFQNNVSYDPMKRQNVTLVNEKKVMTSQQMQQQQLVAKKEEFVGVYNEMERPTTMAQRKGY